MSALQLRLVLESDDIDAALAFYRDTLGLPVQEAYERRARGGGCP